jgi:hypothetical protein
MSSPAFLTFYRLVNVFYASFGLTIGMNHRDIGLVLSSLILAAVDITLLTRKMFDPAVLQPLRFFAATSLGPYWILKGFQYRNLLLSLFGVSFIIFDGVLFLKDLYPKD